MRIEVEKLRHRIIKLRKKKHTGVYANSQFCKNCKKEYNESENFNWSCRTHLGEWGGDLWWCCGKTNQRAPGCKYQKHQSKEDAEEADERRAMGVIFKKMRCYVRLSVNFIELQSFGTHLGRLSERSEHQN